MNKNNGDGKNYGLRNGLMLQNQENMKEIIQGIAEIKGDLKILVDNVNGTQKQMDGHLLEHKDKPEKFLFDIFAKLAKKKWGLAFIAMFLCLFPVALTILMFKFGVEKIIGIFK